ncbi:MAG: hypothetical protein IJW59_00935, partial [Clostridia bacterium]|nr:hypothetical protein [Clostridia bacterium]
NSLKQHKEKLEETPENKQEIENISQRISTLEEILKELTSKEIIENTLEKQEDFAVDNKIREMIDSLLISLPQEKLGEIRYFCTEYNGSLNDYFFKAFAPYFGNPTSKLELYQNSEFKKIIDCAEAVLEISNSYKQKNIENNPLIQPGIEKIKSLGLKDYSSNEKILKDFYNPFSTIFSDGVTMIEESIDGKMKPIIAINLNSKSADRTIIHEIIHAITIVIINNNFVCGFTKKEDMEINKNINEAFTDWLAIKATKIYLKNHPPMISPEIHESNYSRCFPKAKDFLESYEQQVIEAYMSDNPLSFIDSIGNVTAYKINEILGLLMTNYELSENQQIFLDSLSSPTA